MVGRSAGKRNKALTTPKYDAIHPPLQPAPIDNRFVAGPYGDHTSPAEPYVKAPWGAPEQYSNQQPNLHPYPARQSPGWAAPQGGYPAPNHYPQPMNVNVNVHAMAPTLVMAPVEGPSLIVRALWFLCIGWWLSGLAIVGAYLLVYTIIGIPLAFMLFNKLPQITTMKARTRNWAIETRNGVSVLTSRHTDQLNWAVRGLYFVLVGFWLGAVWLSFAWAIGVFIVTLPITLWMYDRAPAVLTLHKH